VGELFLLIGKEFSIKTLVLTLFVVGAFLSSAQAVTTIDSGNAYAYGANFGWLNAHADGSDGAVIGQFVCLGNIYSANTGWINLGSGSPANGIYYQNNSSGDYGVNQDGLGNLRGYAYSANVGWINFENTGAPTVDLTTGNLSGSVWSANCGWISLSNIVAYVQTDTIQPGVDANGDGIADAWELEYFGTININTNSDPNGSGMTVLQDYLDGLNPLQPGNYLQNVASTIDAGDNYAYGANFGWVDMRADAAEGAVIGQYICSGFMYSANVGWIKLGSGFPTNGIYYQNISIDDYGVNQDGLGNLRGYAYGANIGWVNFENTGAPKVDLATGILSGYVWGANVGWISLSNAVAYAKTDMIQPGELDPDGSGLPIAWELEYFETTGIDPNADPDHDGRSNLQEYHDGTNPNDPGSYVQSQVTTIDSVDKYIYSANFGWTDWLGDTNHGAVIGQYVCLGFIYSANTGWIKLGNGAPTNGIYYQNVSSNDFGVNQDGLGNLRGYAYGANIGWINFESTGAPSVNMITGRMSGCAWSANCGWISLSNVIAYLQTDTISPGALAPNGLPIAWLLTYFGTTNVNPNADPTGKGMTIAQDYLAGTDPNNVNSILAITAESFSAGGTSATLTWDSVPTRFYYIQETSNLVSGNWTDNRVGLVSPQGLTTTSSFTDTDAANRFYRIQAVQPLTP